MTSTKQMPTRKSVTWLIAKITKHGYTATDDIEVFKFIIKELKQFGINFTGGKEYGYDAEENKWIIEPNKHNGKKITKYVKDVLGIEPEYYFK